MPISTFYYHLKQLNKKDKYKIEKDEILSIFHENEGCHGYRRITLEMKNRGYIINHKLYLSQIVDLFNGEVISFSLSRHPVFHQVVDMLEKAFEKIPDNTNLILHSDQGWQYQMKQYQYLLEQKGIRQSMSRKGNCLDNACPENLFGILKSEYYYIKEKEYKNIEKLEKDIIEYIEYYNNRRIKSKLNGMSPVQYREHSKLVV